jgi:L-asparagine transporter-like permease
VLSAALSGANASLYVASRMLFALSRSGYAPQRMGVLNHHGVPMGALLVSMAGIVGAILLELRTVNAYLYIINAALVGGMIAWLISLLAHVRFRRVVSSSQLAETGLRSPLGGVGSILGFIAIVAAIACTWWVSQSSVAAKSAGIYLVVLTVGYWLVRKRAVRS